jgi:hypothetical protein
MIPSIKNKVVNAINSNDLDEYKIVFVLTKIRKILEHKNHPRKYQLLNLYCNWALHIKITKTAALKRLGIDIESNISEKEINFLSHKLFFEQLDQFSKDYLSDQIEPLGPEKQTKIADILNEILSDTPLVIEPPKKIHVLISKSNGITKWRYDYC